MSKNGKRIVALCLAMALVFTNIGGSLRNVYAESGTRVDFVIGGSDFVAAIKDMLGSGAEPVRENDLDFTDGKLEKYYQLFFEGQEPLYEFYPEFEGQGMEAEVRAFIRLPEQVDDSYTLTGEEEIILLYINSSENAISCSAVIEMSDGDSKNTKRVNIKSYESVFNDNKIDLGNSRLATEGKANADMTDRTGTQPSGEGQTETAVQPDGGSEAGQTETGAQEEEPDRTVTQEAEPDQSDSTEAEDEESDSPSEEEVDESKETEAEAGESSEEVPGEPVARYSRHMAPRVATEMSDGLPENQAAEPEQPKENDVQPSEDKKLSQEAGASPADDNQTAGDNGTQPTGGADQTIEESTPVESTPEESTPAEITPEESLPAESTPGESTSAESTPEESLPAESTPGESASVESTPGESQSQVVTPDTGTGVATPSEPESKPEAPQATPSNPVSPGTEMTTIGYGDLVGIGGCSTAKAYITTLENLKVLEDIDGFRIVYEITPSGKGSIQNGPNSVVEGESITFGVRAEDGYKVASVEADGGMLEPELTDDGRMRYTLEGIEADQNIKITLEEGVDYPPFSQTLRMKDKMDITISAGPNVLPQGTVATAEIVTEQVEGAIKAESLKSGQEVIAAPAYDINLWLDGKKLDSSEWNKNGSVSICFSGSLMEDLSQKAQEAQVVWVKDQGGAMEVMEDSQTKIAEGSAIESLSCDTSHFTTFAPIFLTTPVNLDNVFDIEALGLMEDGYPKLSVRDKNNKTLDVVEIDDNGITKIMLKGENGVNKPLPRDIKTRFGIAYAMKNSTDQTLKEHYVKAGDTFTYQFPSNIIYEAVSFDVKDAADKTIGTATIDDYGKISIVITEQNMGQNFEGTAGVYGSVDFTGENQGKTEIVIKYAEIEKTLVFETTPVVEKYSATVQKGHTPADPDDTRYSKMGIPEAVRFHVVIKADEGNSGDLTDLEVTDRIGENKSGQITYDTASGVEIESVTKGCDISSIKFGDSISHGNGIQIPIKLLKDDGTAGAMRPGDVVKFNYWVKLAPGAWTNNAVGSGKEEVKASLKLSFSNKVTVEREGSTLGEGKAEFARNIEVVSKSGITHYNEKINGEGNPIPVFIEYHVYLNPNLLKLTGWTVKDTLNQGGVKEQQTYLGEVTINGYNKKNGELKKTYTVTPDSTTWEWKIPDPGNYYYDIQYYTTVPEDPKGSKLSNMIQLLGSEGFPDIGGGTQIGFLYNTYTLSKKNASSQMMDNSYIPVSQNMPGVIGWNGDIGTIRWKTVLTPYANGQNDVEEAVISAGAVYKDQLTVVQYANWAANKYVDIHTFGSLDTLKDGFSLVDGNGDEISPESGAYKLSLDSEYGNGDRGFIVEFMKDVRGPVTIEYNSYVDTDAFAALSQLNTDNLRFKNTALLSYMGTEWTRWSSQPYYIDDYLSKKVGHVNAEKGMVTWELDVNKGYGGGSAPQNLEELGNVDIIETIPAGMLMDSIILKDGYNKYTLEEAKGDYTSEITNNRQTVTIHLNKIAANHGKGIMKKHIQLEVVTRIQDPSVKEFENKAQMIIGDIPLFQVSAKASLDGSYLKKGMKYDSSTAPSAVYTILVNAPGAKLSDIPLRIVDTLEGEQMAYIPESIQVTNANTTKPISGYTIKWYKNSFEILNLPDGMPIKIVYKVMLNGAVDTPVDTKNTVRLYYGQEKYIEDSVDEKVYIVEPYATGSGDFSIKIYKTDQDGLPLEGAIFTLYKVTGIDDPSMVQAGTYSPVINGTNQLAAALIQGLERGQIYYLEETTVPDGYTGADGIYFIIPQSGQETGIPEGVMKLENTGMPLMFMNTRNQITPPPGDGPETPGGGTGGGTGGGSGTGGPGRYSSSPNGPGVATEIVPEQVPLAQWPDESSGITILDEDVPLAPLPKTGNETHGYHVMTLISSIMMGLYLALNSRKKE